MKNEFEHPNILIDDCTNLKPPVLGSFTDYRKYLQAFYFFKKSSSENSIRPYSYATFSAAADIKSPNYLRMIIEGQRNLSSEMTKKFSKALGLNKEDSEEFSVLVAYGQATDTLKRNHFLKKLSELRAHKQLKSGEINPIVYDKVPNWVTWVLYALSDQKNARFDYDRLFDLLKGKAQKDEIRKSLGKLIQSGELTIDPETGDIVKGREFMLGGEDIPIVLVRKLQSELIYLALEALYQESPQDREFGAMTTALTEAEFEQLKFELRQLRKRWTKDSSVRRKNEKGDRVFQLNIQLFPLTIQSGE